MKQPASLALTALAALSLMLAACTTASTQASSPALPAVAAPTPQQIATQICPALQVAIAGMQAIAGLPQGAHSTLTQAQSSANALCAASSALSANDAATLEQLAFQTVLPLVETANPKLAAELEVAQLAVGFVNAIEAGAQAGSTTSPISNAKPVPIQ